MCLFPLRTGVSSCRSVAEQRVASLLLTGHNCITEIRIGIVRAGKNTSKDREARIHVKVELSARDKRYRV